MRWRSIRRLLFVAVFLAVFFWKRERLTVGEKTEELLSPAAVAAVSGDMPTATTEVDPKDKDRVKRERLEELLATFNGTYGVYVERLGDGDSYGVRRNEMFPAASQMKLPVILATYIECEKGELSLDDTYVLQESDKIEWSTLASYDAGSVLTYRQLVGLAAKNSDNSALGILWRRIGDEKVRESLLAAGMERSSFDEDQTSPEEVGKFFGYLFKERLLRRQYREELMGFLTETVLENRIPAGMPAGVRVVHKVGTEEGGYSDGGIVFGKRPFVLVVMGRDADGAEAPVDIAKVARLVWKFEEESI